MSTKKVVLVCLITLLLVIPILAVSLVYAQEDEEPLGVETDKTLPISDWNTSLLDEYHTSNQIKTKVNETYFSLQILMSGNIDDLNKTWDNKQKANFHYADDIKVSYNNEYYSLQKMINHLGIKVKGGVDLKPTTKQSIPIWQDDEHLAYHEADEVRVRIKQTYYSLQYAIDEGLIKFPGKINNTRNVVIANFNVPAGNSQDYDKTCSYRGENYVELTEKINASNLVSGGVYNIVCKYNNGNKITNKVKLNSTFVDFFNTDENHISRILLNNNVYRGTDTFVWQASLSNGELTIRIVRPESCKNRPGVNFDLTQCTIDRRAVISNLIGSDTTNSDQNCVSYFPPASSPYDPVGCGDDRCSGSEWAYGNCFRDCGGAICSSQSNIQSSGLFGGALSEIVDCSEAWRLTYGLQCSERDFCPTYRAPVGLGAGVFRSREIYAWKDLDCQVIAKQ